MDKRKRDINNSNNSDISLKKFKEIDYKETGLQELQNIATLLESPTEGLNKQSSYNRVQNYLVDDNSLKLEKATFDSSNDRDISINTFNKYQPKLSIVPVDKLELLFWKVFRNKYIFKSIFANFKYAHLFRYQDLISSEIILKSFSNGIEIIKDRLKNGEHVIKNNDEFIYIFGKLKKDTSENKEFINYIFNNYKSNNQSGSFNNHLLWIKIIINSLNIVALDIYLVKFNVSVQDIKGDIRTYWQDKKFTNLFSNDVKSIKMYQYLRLNQYIPTTTNIQSFHIFYPSFKFKHLIKFYNSLVTNNEGSKKKPIEEIVQELNQINIDRFPSDVLNLSILSLLELNNNSNSNNNSNNSNNNNNSNSNNNNNKSSSDSLSGNIKLNNLINQYVTVISKLNSEKIQFKEFPQYKAYFKDYNITQNDEDDLGIQTYDHLSDENKISILKKLSSNSNNSKSNNNNNNNSIIVFNNNNNDANIIKILNSLLSSSSLEVIQYILENYSTKVFDSFAEENIFKTIQTNEILEHYFNYYDRLFKTSIFLISYKGNDKILDHLEKLMESSGRVITISDYHYSFFSLEVIERAIRRPSVYQISNSFLIEKYSPLIFTALGNGKTDLVISILSQFKSQSTIDLSRLLVFLTSGYSSDISGVIKRVSILLDWLLESVTLEFILDYIGSNYRSSKDVSDIPIIFSHPSNTQLNYLIRFKDFLNIFSIVQPKGVLEIYTKFKSLGLSILFSEVALMYYSNETIELFIWYFINEINNKSPNHSNSNRNITITNNNEINSSNNLKLNSTNTHNHSIDRSIENKNSDKIEDSFNLLSLYNFIILASNRGLLLIFKKIVLKYGNVLKNGNACIFTETQLYKIVRESVKSLNYELAHLLLNYCNLDTNDFKINNK